MTDSVPLRDYLELHVRRLDDLRSAERARQDDLRAADKEAVRTTREAMEKRLEGLNELRNDVAPKSALDSVSDAIRRVERLVYIGIGLALAASVAIPLLLRVIH
jgi:hypothetical protein